MGFLKNFKSDRADVKEIKDSAMSAFATANAEAAQLATQYAGVIQTAQSMDIGAQLAIGQRIQHLTANGIDGTATLMATRDLGPGLSGNGTSMEFDLTLTSGPGAPRPITIRQDMMGAAAAYMPGQEMVVKVDPNNPTDAMLWATPPTGSDARLAKLEQLAALHQAGAITDEDFAAKKAAVLAED